MNRITYRRKSPRTAIFVAVVLGTIFTVFGLVEVTSALTAVEVDSANLLIGIKRLVMYGFGFLGAAFLLKVRPWIGGIFMISLGLIMAIRILFGTMLPTHLFIVMALVAIPVILGIHVMGREIMRPRMLNGF